MPTWTNESDPLENMQALLEDNWVAFEDIPMPKSILVVNDAEDPRSRFDMNKGDIIVIKAEGPEQIRGRGNYHYYDRIYQVTIEFYTKESRQRLRNISRAIKAIIWDNIHSFTSYQFIRSTSYTESIEENLNIWRGRMVIELISNAVPVETLI